MTEKEEKTSITFHLPISLKQKFSAKCEREGRMVSAMLRIGIESFIEDEKITTKEEKE